MAGIQAEKSAWPAGWVDRVVEMVNARSQKLFGENQSVADRIREWWTGPRMNLAADIRLVLASGGTVAGLAAANNDGPPYAGIDCSATVHPLHANGPELWDWLHAWALRRVAELVPLAEPGIRVAASTRTIPGDRARCAAVERAGFELARVANHMRINLATPTPAPEWPAGISLRTADIDRDLEAIVRLQQETWPDHWGFIARPVEQSLAEWRESLAQRSTPADPSLWFLAVDGPEIVGISLCEDRIVDDATRGYVDSLSVRPAWRKRGIALALLRHTFAEFRRRGYAAAELDMDSQMPRARCACTSAPAYASSVRRSTTRRSCATEPPLPPGSFRPREWTEPWSHRSKGRRAIFPTPPGVA